MAPKFVHPLDELNAEEIRICVSVTKAYCMMIGVDPNTIRWNVCSLLEPSKRSLLAFEAAPGPETLPPRQAFIVIHMPPQPGLVEVVVQLGAGEDGTGTVVSWTKKEGVHAIATPDDCILAETLVKADPTVQSLLAELYDITDMSLVVCDPWSVHTNPESNNLANRCIQCFMYMRTSPDDNQYAHPLDMCPMIDLNTGKILRIDRPLTKDAKPGTGGKLVTADGKVVWNKEDNNYHQSLAEKELPYGWRTPPKQLDVVQPQGPSFTIDGNLITWQNWSFRLGFNYREGVVLHLVNYKEGDTVRPVAHRLSLVEMAVPYADPREPFVRKCAFDVGDYGLGYCASSLSLGCDCLGFIKYFDGTWINSKGEPFTLEKGVCMHEEDVGLLWKHVEYRTGHSESRRSRRLVVSSIATVVNYEYAFYWYFYQDGTLALDIKLTGELSTNMMSPGFEAEAGKPQYGTLVGPGVNAQHHQHMFCARLDMSIDDKEGGKNCAVTEVNVEPLPKGPDNPYGNGFRAVETVLNTTNEAQRLIAPEKGRLWKIVNPSVINPVSKSPIAYKLVPMAGPPLMANEDSIIAKKGAFATKSLWVTPYEDDQRFPSGDYVFNAVEDTGLSVWTKEDKPLLGNDPVIWYAFGVTHVVRPEDFPVMPVEVCGFAIKPSGFFARNPTVDLPPEKNLASKEAAEANGNGTSACCASVLHSKGHGNGNGINGVNGNGHYATPGANGMPRVVPVAVMAE